MKASHTKLTSFRRCRRQFHWTYNLGRDAGSSAGQKVGTIGHAVIAYWYENKDKGNNIALQKECLAKMQTLVQHYDLDIEDASRLERAMLRYLEYSDEYDTFKILGTEVHVIKELGKHTIEGYIDILAEYFDGRRICIDSKFQKRPDISGIELDQQLTLYIWLGEASLAMLNCINVTASKTTKMASVMREITTRTPAYMQTFLNNLEAQLDEMAEFDAHPERERYAYPTPMISCAWDCNFHSVCKHFQQTGDISAVTSLPPRIFDKITLSAEE
jgi:hypothetical protein